jgi:transposase-like protein
MKDPKTLQEAIQFFSDFDHCREFMIAVRWPDGKVRCPYCNAEKVTYLEKARLYRCYGDHPKQKFSLKVGTVFEDSPIALEKWLLACWMLVNCRNGVSSYEIHRAVGVTQKSAWFMLHRIRLAMQQNSFVKLGGGMSEVEVDETFIGGKARNMHKSVRQRRITGPGGHSKDKVMVLGMMERGGHVRTEIISDRTHETIKDSLDRNVIPNTFVYSDEYHAYRALDDDFVHEFVNHMESYVNGRVHTNGIENFWSLVKRGLNGTYIAVEPFHMFRYLDEQAFRYNHRKDERGNKLNDGDRFKMVLSQIAGKRLTFKEVTGKVQETPF